MYNLDAQLARSTMLATFGEDRYKKFVAEINGRCRSKGRMLFWQEEMWKQVQDQLNVRITDFNTIAVFFQHCHVHDEELKQQRVPVVFGTRHITGAHLEAMESMFPHASEVYFGPCWEAPPSHREVLYCDACRVAKKRWLELNIK